MQDVRIDKIFTFLLNHRESFCLMLSPMKKYAGELSEDLLDRIFNETSARSPEAHSEFD